MTIQGPARKFSNIKRKRVEFESASQTAVTTEDGSYVGGVVFEFAVRDGYGKRVRIEGTASEIAEMIEQARKALLRMKAS